MLAIDALIPFFRAQEVAVRTARRVNPGAFVESRRLRNESEIVLPSARGVPVEPRLIEIGGVGRQLPTVGADDAPFVVEHVQDDDVLRALNEANRSQIP